MMICPHCHNPLSSDEADSLRNENAKLRELVKDMWANQEALPYGLYIEIRDRMRELRVVR